MFKGKMESIPNISKLGHKMENDDDDDNKTTYWKKGILGKDSLASNYPICLSHIS